MLETLKLIVQILPLVFDLMDSIEKAIPDGGKGKEKLQYIKETLTTITPQISDIWDKLEKIIDYTVALFNAVGKYKTTDKS